MFLFLKLKCLGGGLEKEKCINSHVAHVVNARPIAEAVLGFRSGVLLFTAAQTGLFQILNKQFLSVREISEKLKLNLRAAEIFLDALTAQAFLIKRNDRYTNSAVSNKFLVAQSTHSLVHNIQYQYRLMGDWLELSKIIRSGKPRQRLEQKLTNVGFVRDYIQGMKELARGTAEKIAEPLSSLAGSFVLDVGGGHGDYLKALLDLRKGCFGVVLDFPKSIQLARRFLKGYHGRVQFRNGDYRKAPFGNSCFDLVLMSHITHDESMEDNRSLFLKASKSLRPGGVLAVHDFLINESHTGPVFSALFSVHMLTYTMKGRVYSKGEYRRMLESTGFLLKDVLPINKGAANQSYLLIATKKGSAR